jgi:hypothetical protein
MNTELIYNVSYALSASIIRVLCDECCVRTVLAPLPLSTYRRGKSTGCVWYKCNMRMWMCVYVSTYCGPVLRINVVDMFWNRISYVKTPSYSITEPFILRCLHSTLLGAGRFFSFVILYTVDRTLWTSDQPVARPLPIHRKAQTQNKRRQTSMPRVWFELTIPVFEPAKIVHTSDFAATVMGA